MASPFTNTNLGTKATQTFMSGNGGGIAQKVNLDKSALLRRSPGGIASSMNNIPENNITGYLGQSTTSFNLAVFSDDSQSKYNYGTILFGKSLTRAATDATKRSPLYTLANINLALEKTQRYALTKEQQNELFNRFNLTGSATYQPVNDAHAFHAAGLKEQFPMSNSQDSFPLTPAAAASVINAVGVLYTEQSAGKRTHDGNSKNRSVGVVTEGVVTVGNLWGNVRVGDSVGFVIKYVENPSPMFVDTLGRQTSGLERTPGSFLQLRAHYDPCSNTPVHSSEFKNPSDQDIDSYDLNARILTNEFEFKIGKDNLGEYTTMDWASMAQHKGRGPPKVTRTSIYHEGYYIPFGRVHNVTKAPLLQLIEKAHRSFESYEELLNYAPVDIVIDLNPRNQLSYL